MDNVNNTGRQDRIKTLQQRIIALKKESYDIQFSAYLDKMWSDLKNTENMLDQLESNLEQNYQLYLSKNAAQQSQYMQQQYMQQPQGYTQQTQYTQQPQGYAQPTQYAQQSQSYTQPTQYTQQPQGYTQPTQYTQQFQGYAQPTQYTQQLQGYTQPTQYTQQLQGYAQPAQYTQQPQGYTQPIQYVQQPVGNGSAELPQKSVEFKVGTVIFGVLGIAFLLVAFITFGLNYMNNVLQGIFLYVLGAVILASSELFFAKRVEKFSYCLTGLGISSLYITTLLNYIYLKIFPGWAALLITVAVTAFFFYLSRKKDSGMIRIICLIGCYISLVPIHQLESVVEFALPAAVIFLVNLAGVYCPVMKRRKAVDIIQYICSFSLVFYLIYLQWLSGLEMWPVFILVCTHVLTLHLLYHKMSEDACYKVLYFIGQAVCIANLLYIGHHEYWLHYGVIGVLVLCAVLTVLLWKKKLRFAPYLFIALYSILAYMMEGDAFWATLACLVVFAINKGCVRFFKEFPVPDAVYTMLSAIGVCCLTRSGDAQILGYVYACGILISCIFVKRFKKYHIFTSMTFGWLFLITEGFKPFLCSILICVLAVIAISAGFYIKDKSIRVYGLVLMIFVAFKLVIFDFYESEAGFRMLVFLIVGLLILGISFLYIYLEKKLNEEENRRLQAGVTPMTAGSVFAEPQPFVAVQPGNAEAQPENVEAQPEQQDTKNIEKERNNMEPV